eukprot:c20959_g1_i1 orf=721-1434(-)
MARAFGDFCLKDFGVIAVPEVTYRKITEQDEFIVLASDGIWDVLSNKEVVQVVSAAPTKQVAARTLVETAVRAWRLKYPYSKADDCTAVCLFLNEMPSTPIANLKLQESAVNSSPSQQTTTSWNESAFAHRGGRTLESNEPDDEDPTSDSPNLKRSKTLRIRTQTTNDNPPFNVKTFSEIAQDSIISNTSQSRPHMSLAECLSKAADDDTELSVLHCLPAVNSLLKIPPSFGWRHRD